MCGGACTPHLPEISCHYGVLVKCLAPGQCGPGSILGRCSSWSWRLQSSKVVTPTWYSQITRSAEASHSQATRSEHHAHNLDAWGEPCGGAFTPHLPEVSPYYRVVVKSFASGQCSPGSIPGRCRSWSRRLQSSNLLTVSFQNCIFLLNFCYKNCVIRSRKPKPVAGTGAGQDWTAPQHWLCPTMYSTYLVNDAIGSFADFFYLLKVFHLGHM